MMKLNLHILRKFLKTSVLCILLLIFAATSVFAENFSNVGKKGYNSAAECQQDINKGLIGCELNSNCKVDTTVVHRCCTWVKAAQTANNDSFSFTPFKGSVSSMISAPGTRSGNKTGHHGYDYSVPSGTEVYAAADGTVFQPSDCSKGAGRLINIKHVAKGSDLADTPNYYTTTYMHLSKIYVTHGQVVKKNQLIGLSGGSNCVDGCKQAVDPCQACQNGKIVSVSCKCKANNNNRNGCAYGSHLHFEASADGSVIDPACLARNDMVSGNPTGLETYDMTADPQQTPLTSDTRNYKSGCVHFFDNDLLALSAIGESRNNPGAVNYYNNKGGGGNCSGNGKRAGKDTGGCSYGRNQMICGSVGSSGDKTNFSGKTFPDFLTELQKENPTLFSKLSGGKSLQDTIKYACNDVKYPNENKAFRDAWAANSNETKPYQDAYMNKNFVSGAQWALRNCGASVSWDSLNPEAQASIVSSTIAGGPGGAQKYLKAVVQQCGADFSKCSTKDLIHYLNEVRATKGYISYGKNNETYKSAQKRAKDDDELTDKSLAIREKVEKDGISAEEAAYQLYQQRLCEEGESSSSVGGGSASGGGGGSLSIAVPQGDKGTKECNVSSYRNSYADCIFCDLFGILFETASGVAKKAYAALADAMAKLVMLGFAIWLSITILKFISAMEQKEPRILIKTILNQAFVVIVVVVFLRSDATTFFGMAMEPIFNTGMKLAQVVVDESSCKNDFGLHDNGGLPISMGINILCTIKAIQDKLLDVMALGSTSLCVGFFVESWRGWPIFPNMGYVIVGLVLWISALLFMIIYPFLLIDAVLQLSVATALLPMAVAAYAFKVTRKKYVGKIWETFLNCMFSFVFLTIIVFILSEALTGRLAASFERTNILNAGTDSDYSIISSLAWWGTTFLELAFIMLIGWAVLGEAKSLAGNFAETIGVGKQDIGSNVGTLAMSGVKGIAKPTVLGAGRLVGKGMSAVGNTVKEKANNARMGFQAWRMKNNSNATLDENGNVVVNSKSWFLRRNVTKVLSTDASGRQNISRTKTKGNGASTTTKTDTFFSVKEQRDKNGNVISRKTEMKAAGGKYMINKDGSVNQVALHAIRNGSTHDADTVNEALLNQMLAERMPGIEGATLNGSFTQRNVRSFKDDKGRDVFEVSQVHKDGTRSNFRMTLSGNRALTEYETITKKGEAVKYSSDGIVNKKSSYQYNKDGENGSFGSIAQGTVKDNFSFTSYYQKMGGRPMDSLGNISNSVPKDEIMFGAEDMKAFQDQIARKGQQGPLGGFK